MIKITPVRYGATEIKESWIFRDGDPKAVRPISLTVYLVETEDRKILVDAGCDTMPGFDLRYHVSPPQALFAQTGVSSQEITDVILTHSHHDHVEAVGHFLHARIHLERREYGESVRKLLTGADLNLFEEEYTVAPGVRVVRWGGHSPGSCAVEAEKTVITGDECYSKDCILRQIPTGISCNPEQSQKFIEYYRDGWEILTCHDL